jgi:adenosylcobinamide-phosphate synthase
MGIVAWILAVGPPVALSVALTRSLPLAGAWALHAGLLWFALGARSLADHIAPVERALAARELAHARALTSRVVTRDLSDADEPAVARAAIESALENGNDAIFGALFWFAIAGGPGALAFRLANTLDAMWGYRTPRLLHFGWAAARLDDIANYVPARLTALTYAICGDHRTAIRCWRTQAHAWDSPNAGPVMASGAGSLNVSCGGAARYHGVEEVRPVLGAGREPSAKDVGRALALVRRSIAVWLVAFALFAAASMTV